MNEFSVEINVTEQTVRDLLDCAWEGGSNYWAEADGSPSQAFKSEGVVVRDYESDKEYVLNQKALTRGLQVMSQKYSWHWANLFNHDMDAETGDVFLQCCLFGEIVYG